MDCRARIEGAKIVTIGLLDRTCRARRDAALFLVGEFERQLLVPAGRDGRIGVARHARLADDPGFDIAALGPDRESEIGADQRRATRRRGEDRIGVVTTAQAQRCDRNVLRWGLVHEQHIEEDGGAGRPDARRSIHRVFMQLLR
jgi:hypothetical protein